MGIGSVFLRIIVPVIIAPSRLYTVRQIVEIVSAFRFDRTEGESALFVVDRYPVDVGDRVAGFSMNDQETTVFHVLVRTSPVERKHNGFIRVIDREYGTMVP